MELYIIRKSRLFIRNPSVKAVAGVENLWFAGIPLNVMKADHFLKTMQEMADKPDVEPIYDRCVQFDARFPNQNQSRNCFQNLLDYQRCVRLKGDDYEPCQYFKFAYRNICPSYYIQRMEELHEQRISFQRPPGARSWELHDLKF